jgi:hypothetical protein
MKHLFAALLALALLPACGKDEPKEQPAPEPTVEAPKPEPKQAPKRLASLAPDEPRTRISDVPTSADLEEEANRTVAVENLEAELDRLEAEIVGIPE